MGSAISCRGGDLYLLGCLIASAAAPAVAQDKVRILVHSFIPSKYPGSEAELVPMPNSGKTMVKADLPVVGTLCFGTDDRSFSSKPDASARITADVILLATAKPMVETEPAKRFKSGSTRKINCSSGAVEKTAYADVSGCSFGTPAYGDNKVQVVMTCKAADPLVPLVPQKFTPDLHFGGTFTYNILEKTLSFKGDIGAFPSYEAYASLNGGSFTPLFKKEPEKGANSMSLIDLWQHINNRKLDVQPVKL